MRAGESESGCPSFSFLLCNVVQATLSSHGGIKREKRWELTLTTVQWYVNECVLMDYSKIQTEWPRASMAV